MKQLLTLSIALLFIKTYAQDKPNIILLMADDLGWVDISMNNKLRDWLIKRDTPTGTWRASGKAVAYPPLNMKNNEFK